MSAIRYLIEFDGEGHEISRTPYTVSDEQLAEERANAMMVKLRQMFKDGAYPIVSKPAEGEKRITSIQADANGKFTVTREP